MLRKDKNGRIYRHTSSCSSPTAGTGSARRAPAGPATATCTGCNTGRCVPTLPQSCPAVMEIKTRGIIIMLKSSNKNVTGTQRMAAAVFMGNGRAFSCSEKVSVLRQTRCPVAMRAKASAERLKVSRPSGRGGTSTSVVPGGQSDVSGQPVCGQESCSRASCLFLGGGGRGITKARIGQTCGPAPTGRVEGEVDPPPVHEGFDDDRRAWWPRIRM